MRTTEKISAERVQLQDGRMGIFIETNTPINQAVLTISYKGKQVKRALGKSTSKRSATKKVEAKQTKIGSTLLKRLAEVKEMKRTGNYTSSNFDDLMDAL